MAALCNAVTNLWEKYRAYYSDSCRCRCKVIMNISAVCRGNGVDFPVWAQWLSTLADSACFWERLPEVKTVFLFFLISSLTCVFSYLLITNVCVVNLTIVLAAIRIFQLPRAIADISFHVFCIHSACMRVLHLKQRKYYFVIYLSGVSCVGIASFFPRVETNNIWMWCIPMSSRLNRSSYRRQMPKSTDIPGSLFFVQGAQVRCCAKGLKCETEV